MPTKAYFTAIAFAQQCLLAVGITILLVGPVLFAYYADALPEGTYTVAFNVSLLAVFLVMSIRPLADLLPRVSWLRPLVILRKGMGVFSASIIVAIMFSKIMLDGVWYVSDFFAPDHWSLQTGAILAPLGDLSALILLVTSNRFSKRILGQNWKRIQKLAYVYFYAGALYEYIFLGQTLALVAALIVTMLVVTAYVTNRTEHT